MDNNSIIQALKTCASLMELHEENDFKIRSYNNAIFNLEKENRNLADLPIEEIAALKGVGKSIAGSINKLVNTGRFEALDDLLKKTPKGLLEILKIKWRARLQGGVCNPVILLSFRQFSISSPHKSCSS